MKVVFKGIIEKRRKGCGACGRARSDSQFLTIKTYILPSRMTKTFRVGVPVEVTSQDRDFLMQFKYLSPDGEEKSVFEDA